MWSPTVKSRRTIANCNHEQLEVSVATGLQRRVCLDCGHVSISFITEVVDMPWLERQTADT